jgi:hypothetical protein
MSAMSPDGISGEDVVGALGERVYAGEVRDRNRGMDTDDILVNAALDALGFALGVSWQTRRCNGFEALDSIYLVELSR